MSTTKRCHCCKKAIPLALFMPPTSIFPPACQNRCVFCFLQEAYTLKTILARKSLISSNPPPTENPILPVAAQAKGKFKVGDIAVALQSNVSGTVRQGQAFEVEHTFYGSIGNNLRGEYFLYKTLSTPSALGIGKDADFELCTSHRQAWLSASHSGLANTAASAAQPVPSTDATTMPTIISEKIQETKECAACHVHLSKDKFSKSTLSKNGLQGYCKRCSSIDSKNRSKKNRRLPRMKRCRKCHALLLRATAFDDGKATCKTCKAKRPASAIHEQRRRREYMWTEEELRIEALKYNNISDFNTFNRAAYSAISRRGLVATLCGHMDKQSERIMVEDLKTLRVYVSVNECARILKIPRDALYAAIRANKIFVHKKHRLCLFVPTEEVVQPNGPIDTSSKTR